MSDTPVDVALILSSHASVIRTPHAPSPTPEPSVEASATARANAFSVPAGSLGEDITSCEGRNYTRYNISLLYKYFNCFIFIPLCFGFFAELTAELDKFQREIGIQVKTTRGLFRRQQLFTIFKVKNEIGLVVLTGVCLFEFFYNITELYTEAGTLQTSCSFCLRDDDALLLTFMKLYHDVTFPCWLCCLVFTTQLCQTSSKS